jgi:hypothetical protein
MNRYEMFEDDEIEILTYEQVLKRSKETWEEMSESERQMRSREVNPPFIDFVHVKPGEIVEINHTKHDWKVITNV